MPAKQLIALTLLLLAGGSKPAASHLSPANSTTDSEQVCKSTESPSSQEFKPSASEGFVRVDNKAYVLDSAVWKTSVIPVCWEPGVPQGKERAWVQGSILSAWGKRNSRLTFLGWGTCASDAVGVRIDVVDDGEDDGPRTKGLGTQVNAIPSGLILNFTFNTWSRQCKANEAQREHCLREIAVHEFGHALGFAHEQNRPDTPGECAKLKLCQGPNGSSPISLTPWDPNSVMNYCNGILFNDGKLSQYDLLALRHYYGS